MILDALWYILPAYLANSSPVIFGGGAPIDFGRNFVDGRRIFGDGKTWRGFFGGLTAGTLIGIIQYFLRPYYYGSLKLAIKLSFLLALGALVGDLIGSFIKRRLNMPRGYPAVGLDQWGFLITALIFAYPVKTIPTGQVLFLLAITPVIHWAANVFAYKMGWKDVPW
ncbi:CDP-2,3-bis-(O-geranylgeranyl)-sn-glycerol synthase [Pyrococcus yayanosii]|uniref:CDP-archaeol synthase n=1 Tax=Pyrococcus yayanosii (strain CH1 / JCM 16557) TaxID=529709 RepID=F8AI06_PYRYC|nr:CDP-2,3-bis-(O-geranylgeranyl)-sn-glycerol synthase [Pyrococcus yayanosii]AEH25463.1 hypothetical protein PYCH_18060 [Pyrococcus yayanosii CH1]